MIGINGYPPGTIVFPMGDLARYTRFLISTMMMKVPNGTVPRPVIGTSVARNKNAAFKDFKGEWIWSMGDDHTWPQDLIPKLLDRNVDVVAPLVLKRKPPFHCVVYKGPAAEKGFYSRYRLRDMPAPGGGLFEAYACSTAGMLIRRHVMEKLAYPWFTFGATTPDAMGEDLTFCDAVRNAGFKIHVDLDQPILHLSPMGVKPRFENGQWYVEIDCDNGFTVLLDPPEDNQRAVPVVADAEGGLE